MGKQEEIEQYDDRCVHYQNASGSSWQTTDTWYQWIRLIASILAEGIPGAHVILVDSYRVHFAHPTLCNDLATELNVHLYPLIRNSTQFCQPMDQFVISRWKSNIKS